MVTDCKLEKHKLPLIDHKLSKTVESVESLESVDSLDSPDSRDSVDSLDSPDSRDSVDSVFATPGFFNAQLTMHNAQFWRYMFQ